MSNVPAGTRRLHPVGEALLAARGTTANAVVSPEDKSNPLPSNPVQGQPKDAGDSRGFARLFAIWLFAQCFLYTELGYSINVGITLSADRIIYLVLIAVFLMQAKRLVRTFSSIEWMMLAFTVVTTVSWFTGGADWDSRSGKLRWLTTLVTLCYQPFVGYYIARRVHFDRTAITKLLWGVAIIGVYLGLTGIFEHFDQLHRFVYPRYILNKSVGVQFGRARGPFAAAVVNGGALIVSFLSATFLWSSQTGRAKMLMFLGVMSPIALTVYFTDTRGVWVGFGITLAIIAITKTRMRKLGLWIVGLAALVYVSGAFSKFSMWETSLFSRRTETVDYRYANYATTWKMFQRNPLFGIGYGNFNKMWRQYFVTDDGGETRDLTDGNNTTFLCILGEEGLIGCGTYILIFIFAARICWKAYFRLRGENWEFERRLVVVTGGILGAFLLMGVTTDVRFHSFYNVSLFMYLGLISDFNISNEPTPDSAQSATQNDSPRMNLHPLAGTRS